MQLSLMLEKDVIADNQVVGKLEGICWQKGVPCLLKIGDKTFTADRVKIKGDVVATNLLECAPLPTLHCGKAVYDTDGKLLGTVQEVELTSTLKIKGIGLDCSVTILPSKIVGNNDIVTVRTNKPKVAKKRRLATGDTPQQIDVDTAPLQSICGEASTAKNVVKQIANTQTATGALVEFTATETSTAKQATPLAPRRRSGDFSFLVGKIVDKNIFNFLGELMIKEGEIVSREVYLKARYFGKLTELCLHTK